MGLQVQATDIMYISLMYPLMICFTRPCSPSFLCLYVGVLDFRRRPLCAVRSFCVELSFCLLLWQLIIPAGCVVTSRALVSMAWILVLLLSWLHSGSPSLSLQTFGNTFPVWMTSQCPHCISWWGGSVSWCIAHSCMQRDVVHVQEVTGGCFTSQFTSVSDLSDELAYGVEVSSAELTSSLYILKNK